MPQRTRWWQFEWRHFVKIFVQVRELIKRKLRITREIPFNRVSRVFHGPEFRGQKPVQVRLI